MTHKKKKKIANQFGIGKFQSKAWENRKKFKKIKEDNKRLKREAKKKKI